MTLAERASESRRRAGPVRTAPPDGERQRWSSARWFADGSLGEWLRCRGLDEEGLDHALRLSQPDGRIHRTRTTSGGAPVDPEGNLVATCFAPALDTADRRMAPVLDAAVAGGVVAAGHRERLRRDMRTDLLLRISQLATRTLLLELNVARVQGRLPGASPTERYESFVRGLADAAVQRRVLQEYPVLDRLVADEVDRWLTATATMLVRLRTAWQDGAWQDGRAPGRPPGMTWMSASLGDPHRGGQTVRAFALEDGRRLVYKPRTMANEVAFAAVDRLLRRDGRHPGTVVPESVDHGDWGLQSWVAHEPVVDEEQFGVYHRRLGWLLAVAHATLLTDLHYENVIAHGAYPVLVDLETLGHPSLHHADGVGGAPGAAESLFPSQRSVLETGLLPHVVFMESRGLDISGVSGGPTSDTTLPARGTGAARTDRAAIEIQQVTPQPRHNIVFGPSGEAPVGPHVDDLLAGFADGYDAVLALDRTVLRDLLAGCHIRVIPRSTRTYVSALAESTHPSLLTDAMERELYLSHLWGSVRHPGRLTGLVDSEQRDLLVHDVPVFHAAPGSTDLTDSGGRHLSDVLARSPHDELDDHLRHRGASDRSRQLRLTEVALCGVSGRPPGPEAARSRLTARTVDDAVAEIAGAVAGAALPSTWGPTWLGIGAAPGGRYGPRGVDEFLYSGRCGTALFLALAAPRTGDRHAGRIARETFDGIRRRVTDDVGGNPVGAWDGVVGMAYAFALAAPVLDEPRLLQAADRIGYAVLERARTEPADDVVSGSAGIVLAAVAVDGLADGGPWAELAHRTATELADRAVVDGDAAWWRPVDPEVPALTGFAHGVAGMAAALGVAGRRFGAPEWTDLARAAWRWEDRFLDRATGTWADRRTGGTHEASAEHGVMHAWCHGAPGIALGRVLAEPDGRHASVGIALRSTASESRHGLCHGSLGNLVVAQRLLASDPRATGPGDLSEAYGDVVLDMHGHGIRAGGTSEVQTDGLMTGLAGIGYALLRAGDPAGVPDVLALEAPDPTSPTAGSRTGLP